MRRWRKASWAIAMWTAGVCVAAAVAMTDVMRGYDPSDVGADSYLVGAEIVLSFFVVVWLLVAIPLGILWLVTRPRR